MSAPLVCLDRLHYVHDLFLASDTTVAMLTDVPNSGPGDAPVPYAENLGTARFAASLAAGSTARVLPQVVLAPNFGGDQSSTGRDEHERRHRGCGA